jgi:hypothetical protein
MGFNSVAEGLNSFRKRVKNVVTGKGGQVVIE